MPIQTVSVAGNFRVPVPANEPSRDFAPGSQEAQDVLKKISEVKSAVRDLPHVINGERILTGATSDVVAPHEHSLVLGKLPSADEAATQSAIEAGAGPEVGIPPRLSTPIIHTSGNAKMTVQDMPTTFFDTPPTTLDDDNCHLGVEDGQCFYCTGPETD
ncbi:hypothetical protein NG701_00525 [Pseudarthrobacter sp. HLT3-5]|uniref:hypothetical protein n=1 Tax=Pseudarthrobacter cellobiosi TaxID=2953654 RepID=UPI00208E6DE5|nr:hypothetical protein [Pseudarthrobacter sp. HLT3-5]MCO4272932.1 hypothetical protein [Pseudarthrobacter sp. HLT3-5]